jgi:regulator of nucleoside diphosphate kinase
MLTRTARAAPPAVVLSETDAERLFSLAASQPRSSQGAQLLMAEIERAEVWPDHLMPDSIVGMHSIVVFWDREDDSTRRVELVYPAEADISAGRISVLTPVGAGLIGLSPGQSISWPRLDGHGDRLLRIVAVSGPSGR